MPDDGTEFRISAVYGFVRARQLEGTFPGDAATGVWPITVLRIGYGGAFCQMMSGHSRILSHGPRPPNHRVLRMSRSGCSRFRDHHAVFLGVLISSSWSYGTVTKSRSATRTTMFLLLSLKVRRASSCFHLASANLTPLNAVSSATLRLITTSNIRTTENDFFMCLFSLSRVQEAPARTSSPKGAPAWAPLFHHQIRTLSQFRRDCDVEASRIKVVVATRARTRGEVNDVSRCHVYGQ